MASVELDIKQINALLERVKEGKLQKGDYEIIQSMANAIIELSQALNKKAASIKRLLNILFGPKTEKKKVVIGKDEPEEKDTSAPPEKNSSKKEPSEKKKKGHGRRPSSEYTGASKESVSHEEYSPQDPCPLCPKGKLYPVKTPGVTIRINGCTPLSATVYELEKLRCNLCGEVFTAKAPDGITGKHYDESAKAVIAVLKYGYGFPWCRLEQFQQNMGVPLPSSTQWDLVESTADLIFPAFNELVWRAAQGNVLHNDDTPMKVLDLIQENKSLEKNDRTGIFTSGIVSIMDENKKAVIFLTGRRHAGENIASIYEKRESGKSPPIQMCDALSRNTSSDFKIILSHCLTHARRNFVEVAENFPQDCRFVIEQLAQVYQYDTRTKTQNMSPDQRLKFHQTHSAPVMKKLYDHIEAQVNDHLVEPNSGLGEAITYMIKYREELTRFLTTPGAPLDNNICEQALKRCILHRKNSLFYKTEHGAFIGDIFMSLIHTCSLMKVNALEYLIALQKNAARVFAEPSQWMPWNYKDVVCQDI